MRRTDWTAFLNILPTSRFPVIYIDPKKKNDADSEVNDGNKGKRKGM